jgi:Pyridoxamine 5'-phosphate oxidase
VSDLLAEIQRRSYAAATETLKGSWPESDALDPAGIAALVGRHRYCVLATGRADGRAHAAPVAFALGEAAIWFATVEGLRLRNLRATGWAALVVMEESPHRALTAEGPVVLHEGDAFPRAFQALRETWRERHGGEPDWAVALAELRPERVFSYSG